MIGSGITQGFSHQGFEVTEFNRSGKSVVTSNRGNNFDALEFTDLGDFSVFGGFDFKMSSEIFMIIDAFQFHLKAKGDMAWARSKHEDISIIETLLNGVVVKIRSDSAYGTYAIDEYSLKGITLAYLRMKEICR